jgi:hypothetical protein
MSTSTIARPSTMNGTMTDEQRFTFDLKGWLLLPAVLSEAESRACRDHLLAGGSPFRGPTQELLDHPAITPILHGILSDRAPHDDVWQFRCENSFPTIRSAGWKSTNTDVPHVVLPARTGGPMTYHCKNGRIYAGLVRVVWEFNPVRRRMGGTLFLSGTHKSEFPWPDSLRVPENDQLESYECPAGSVFIFTESLLHAADTWRDTEHQRVAMFSAYNSVWAQWHRLNPDVEAIAGMPPKRQSLFRGVYAADFEKGKPTSGQNLYYSPENRAL